MRNIMTKLSGIAVLLAFALPASVAWGQSGIGGTAHDFTSFGGSGLCTFCHTPHVAMTQELLWNHTLSSNSFDWTNPTTTAGTDYPAFAGDTYQGATAKCLSCHDGSVAIGDIGLGDPGSLGSTFLAGSAVVGGGGNMDGNHPVAMPFPFMNQGSTYNGATTGSGIELAEWQPDPTLIGIRLFTDDGAGNVTAGPTPGQTGMECSSCHDPHNGVDVEDSPFLRGAAGGNGDNYICVKCHDK